MNAPNTQTLRLERIFACTPEQLYDAWVDPAQYAKWFNPFPGKDAEILEWDARPGGKVRFNMVTPDGQKYPNEGTFLVLDRPRELVTGEADGMKLRVTFEAVGKRTRMVIEQTGLPMEVPLDQARAGWGAILDKLQSHAITVAIRASAGGQLGPTGQGFTIERTFRAAPAKVWAMWTTKEGLERWFVPDGWTSTVTALDLRPGGAYEITMTDGTQTVRNHGTYREVVPPRRLAYTWHFDVFLAPGEQPYDVPMAVELEPFEGGTRMRFTQGPLATPEFTEGSRQGVAANFEKLAKALGE